MFDERELELERRAQRQQRRRDELVRAEQAVLEREGLLAAAVSEVDAKALSGRRAIEALSARVAEALLAHGDAPGLLTVVRQLDVLEAPAFDMSDHRARELAVREEAVRARDWLATSLEAELQRFNNELEELSELIALANVELDQLPPPSASPPGRGRGPIVTSAWRAPRRREQPRVRMETEIDLTSASNFFSGFSENLSDGGVFVATDRRVPIGAEVELAFRLPDGTEVRGRGVVRWTRSSHDAVSGIDAAPGVGVQFVELNGPAEEAVRRFLATRDPIFYPG